MITPYSIATRFDGRREINGIMNDPMIMEWLKLDADWPQNDETPWCSAFVNWICWIARVERSKSLMARSWLITGKMITIDQAQPGFDIVILKRGGGGQPGPENRTAPGHVGFYSSHKGSLVRILGGNQDDMVCFNDYPSDRILGIRRLE